jgi:hypothetical protein
MNVGSIPDELSQLSNLEILRICDSSMSGSIPQWISSLSRLKSLYLFANQLRGSIPSTLAALRKLSVLHLHTNRLSGTLPSTLGYMLDLEDFVAYQNMLEGTIPDSIRTLSQLSRFAMDKNRLGGTVPVAVGEMTKLAWISFRENRLEGTVPAIMSQLRSLNFLDFGLHGSLESPMWCGTKEACTAWLSAKSLADSLKFAVGSRVADVDGDLGEIVEVDAADASMPYNVRYDNGAIYWMPEAKLIAVGAVAAPTPSPVTTMLSSSSEIEPDVDARSSLAYGAVDCAVTPWAEWHAAEPSDPTQPKLARERFVMEAPAFGGAACPSLVENQLVCSESPGDGANCAEAAEAIDTGGMREMLAFLRARNFEQHIHSFILEQVEIEVAMTLSETDFINLGMSLVESKRILLELGRWQRAEL